MFKSYLKLQMLSAVVLLGFLAAFNYLSDPYELFGRGPVDKEGRRVNFPTRRAWANTTINRVVNGDYDTLFMGTSKPHRGLDPGHIARGFKAYNASFSSCTYENMYIVLRQILEKKKISTLVVGIDYTMERRGNNLTTKGFSPASLTESLLGFHTTKESLMNLKRKWIDRDAPVILVNGYKILPPKIITLQWYRDHLNHMVGSLEKKTRLPMSQGQGWPYFRAIVRECKSRNINLILFISPVHAKILEGIVSLGLYEEFETWVRMIVHIAYDEKHGPKDKPRVWVWQFCGYNAVTTDPLPEKPLDKMRWYFETSHYRKEVGNMILDRVLENSGTHIPRDFGVLLTPENINACLEKIRSERKAYLGGDLRSAERG